MVVGLPKVAKGRVPYSRKGVVVVGLRAHKARGATLGRYDWPIVQDPLGSPAVSLRKRVLMSG